MTEEAFVLRRQDGAADDRRNVRVWRDEARLDGQFDERLVVGVVDRPDGRELESQEGPEVRQRAAVR
jgi:hypothetical protein